LFDAYIDSVGKYKHSQATFSPNKDNRPSPLLVDLLSKERVGVHPGLPDYQANAPGMSAPGSIIQPMRTVAAAA
jgi:hypothetical protein